MASDPRAICADCGHARSWHDRDAARKAAQADTGPERPCYREIGGAPCRCSGFRDSGEVAVSASLVPSPASFSKNLILTLLLVVTGVALLYAYRSQTPSVQIVALTQAIQEISGGQVRSVTIVMGANKATLQLATGEKQQVILPDPDQVFIKAVTDYNAANPARQIAIEYQTESGALTVIGSVILSLIPVILIGSYFFYMMRKSRLR